MFFQTRITIIITNINLMSRIAIRNHSQGLCQKALEYNVMYESKKINASDVNTTQKAVKNMKEDTTQKVVEVGIERKDTFKSATDSDRILEESAWLRSEEGIRATLGIKKNNETLQDKINTEIESINADIDYSSTEDLGNSTTTELNSTPINTLDYLKDPSFIYEEPSRVDYLNLDSWVSTVSKDFNIISKVLSIIEKLIKALENGHEFEDLSHIWIYICILWFFLLIFYMFIVGILNAIKDLWHKAQRNFISKLQNMINIVKLKTILTNTLILIANNTTNYVDFMIQQLKKFGILNKIIDIINIKNQVDDFKSIMSNLKRFKNSIKPNKIGYYSDPIVFMNPSSSVDYAPFPNPSSSPDISNPGFHYGNSPIYPPLVTKLPYKSVVIWKDILDLDTKYHNQHKYYCKLIEFLRLKSHSNRSPQEKKEGIYTVPWLTTDQDTKDKFIDYANKHDIILTKAPNNIMQVELISRAIEFKVNEAEIMTNISQILNHYYNFNLDQKNRWQISQQPKVPQNNTEPDFYVRGRYQGLKITKLIIEVKTYDGDSFFSMMKQIENSSMFTLGDEGHYTDEFDKDTCELKFTGSSQFVILIRGTQIAFLERYSYSLSDLGVNAWHSMVPLTMPVDTSQGIENPRLKHIMSKYGGSCNEVTEFPFGEGSNIPGKYFVFDIITNHDACHELFMYVSSELPRLHIIN